MLDQIIQSARADPAFAKICARFAESGIQSWLLEDEKALHFGIGAFAPGGGLIVEIGTFEGASACFLGAGIARRGHGRLVSVDPHLGGPPWLGMAPHQRTLEKFRAGTRFCGVADWIESRIGDSAAVAATWPAQPIDAVFIDADHSFLGALKDFECWAPKVRPGGLVMFDDADDPALPELLDLVEFLKALKAVTHVRTVQGVAVFRVNAVGTGKLLSELNESLAGRGIRRPWDMAFVHELKLPPHYGRGKSWTDHGLDIAYQLCFLARCGPGDYGYGRATTTADRALLEALSRDRQDGRVVAAADARGLRAVLCDPEEASALAPRLQPGGVLIARHGGSAEHEAALAVRKMLLDAGLDGCGWHERTHWGVWRPHFLAPECILDFTRAGFAPR